MSKPIRILILEDNPADVELNEYELKNAGIVFTSKVVTTEESFVQGIEEFSPDIILSDYDLPGYDGALALAEAKKRCPDIPFILVTGAVTEDRAIEILTSGARDYVLKSRLNRLVPAVQRSFAEAQEHKARKKAEESLRKAHGELEATVRRRTEELQASEERFRSIAENSSVIMWMTYANGDIEFLNRAGREFFGVTLKQVSGRAKWRQLLHPDDIEAYAGAFADALRNRSAFHAQARVRRADGEWRWIESYAAPRLSSDGQFLGMAGSSPDITERIQTERKLQESEDRFRSAFDYGSVPMTITALDGRLMRVNPAFARMLGYSESELAGMNFIDITHPADRAANRAGLEPVMRGEQDSFRMEKRYIRKDGQIIWIDMSTASVRDTTGKPLYIVTHAQDITKRKRALEELKKGEANLREAQHLAKIGSWEWDCKGGEVHWSDEMYVIHSVDPQTFVDIPGSYRNLIHPDDRKSVFDSVTLALDEYMPNNMKYRIVLPDGSVRRLQSKGEITAFDEEGEPARMIGTIQDITEREEAEEMIRALFDASNEIICLVDKEGKVIIANKGFARSMEKDASELIGRHITEIIPSEAGIRKWNHARQSVIKGEVIQFDDERNGRYFHFTIYPILNALGKTEKIGMFAQEITEIKRTAEELEKRTTQLEEANRELEAFIYSVSHDLQAPIRAMDGFSKMILQDYGPNMNDVFRQRFDMIRGNAQRMADLIQALLNLSQIGRRRMTFSKADMKEIFDNVWDDLQSECIGRRIDFKLADLPPAFVDRNLIRQAIFNLLANAVKFTAKKTRAVIRIGSYTEGGNAIYFIKDNGAGFDMAYSGKLFQTFKRLHSGSEYKGTGIGLAIVQRIIARHGGKVWAEGALGKGATFYFSLPTGPL